MLEPESKREFESDLRRSLMDSITQSAIPTNSSFAWGRRVRRAIYSSAIAAALQRPKGYAVGALPRMLPKGSGSLPFGCAMMLAYEKKR